MTSSEKPAVYRRPGPDVYTVLLVIALLAIIVSCIFLYLYMADYEFKFKGGPTASLSAIGGAQVAAAMVKLRMKDEG
ncbi:MAG: hypothetical protein ACLQLG_03205 [Thermoguttaceae bacterium]